MNMVQYSYTRPFVKQLKSSLLDHSDLIHVVTGPRQVGKTTGVRQILAMQPEDSWQYVAADGDLIKPASWLQEQYILAVQDPSVQTLVIDEIQKVDNWSEVIKKLWDQGRQENNRLQLILLGSSSLHLQKGLSESLAGRYMLHRVYHWTFEESAQAFNMNMEQYLSYGGYPKSYGMLNNHMRWLQYIQSSIIEPVLGKDILSMHLVKSPALFRQCFDIACSYAAQEISYTKLLGQLQDKGNTDLIKRYLELFEGAFLLKQLFKFSRKKTIQKTSSPKILPMCPALYSQKNDGIVDEKNKGRAFELMVGTHLAQFAPNLYYWRDKNEEVDFVISYGKKIWAIEVKTQVTKTSGGLMAFQQKFPEAQLIIMHRKNVSDMLEHLQTQLSGFILTSTP